MYSDVVVGSGELPRYFFAVSVEVQAHFYATLGHISMHTTVMHERRYSGKHL